MVKWEHYKLGDIAEITMGQSPQGENCNEIGNGTPLLNGPTEFGDSFPTPVQFTTDPKKLASSLDLLFCVRGSTTGRMNWADREYAIGRGLASIRHREGKKYRYFIKGLIDVNLRYLLQSATGSTFPNVSRDQLNNLQIAAPPLDIQESIAEILSSLDDKIGLNNQINKNLEALAQALFKQWFVDFEFPDKNGKPYKSSGGEMVESEFGEIPKGWAYKSLYNFATYINGAAYKDKYFSESPDALPVIKIVELKNGISKSTKYTNVNLGEKYRIDTGDILFSWSGSPETSIDTFLWVFGEAWLNQHIFKIVCKNIEERAFVYSMLKYWNPQFISIAKNKQTTGLGHVTVKDLKELTQPCPSADILKRFSLSAIPMLDQLQSNLEEIKYLSELRDMLLPKLISGELQVSEPINMKY